MSLALPARILILPLMLLLASNGLARGERVIAFGSKELAPALRDWVVHRKAQGVEVIVWQLLPNEEKTAEARRKRERKDIADMQLVVERMQPTAVLLAGNVAHVPAGEFRYKNWSCETDRVFGLPDAETGLPKIPVGRIPAATAKELEAVLAKVIRYETQFEPGEGRNRVLFAAGTANFGPVLDRLFEGIATQMLSEKLAQHYVMDLLYESPASPYFVAPHYASRYVRAALERNPRIAVYTGHGAPRSFARIRYRGREHYFGVQDLAGMNCGPQSPLFFALTCSTGDYEDPLKPGLCASLVLEPGGPVASFGSSEVSQPVPNLLLNLAVLEQLANEQADGKRPKTLGQAILAIRRALETKEHPFAWAIETLARGEDDVAGHKRHTQHLYNLFGDPSMRLRFPANDLEMHAVVEGDTLVLRAKSPSVTQGTARIRYELDRRKLRERPASISPKLGSQKAADAYRARHAAALNKTLHVQDVSIEGGSFLLKLPIETAFPGRLAGRAQQQFWFRVYAWNAERDAVGALRVPAREMD